jgi:hypothetical protein
LMPRMVEEVLLWISRSTFAFSFPASMNRQRTFLQIYCDRV